MRLVSHPNICALQFFFYSNGEKQDEVFLNLMLEYVPETIYRAGRHYTKLKQPMPMLLIKVRGHEILGRVLARPRSVFWTGTPGPVALPPFRI